MFSQGARLSVIPPATPSRTAPVPRRFPVAAAVRCLTTAVSLCCAAIVTNGQIPPDVRQSRPLLLELNRDLWTPYLEAFKGHDPEKYLTLLAPEFVRVEGDQKVVRPLAEYAPRVRRTFDGWKDRDLRAELQFHFTERIVRGAYASERGVYQFLLFDPEGVSERSFGAFLVVARKIDGVWKIAVEYDTSRDGAVTLADFQQAAGLTDFSRF